MLECFSVLNKLENRLYLYVNEDHAERHAKHLGVEYDLHSTSEISTVRTLQSPDHAADSEAFLTRLGV